MEEFKNISRTQIEAKLDGENLRVNRIISLAIMSGAILFLCVIIFLYLKSDPKQINNPQTDLTETLTMVLAFIALSIYSGFFLLPKFFLNKKNIERQIKTMQLTNGHNSTNDPVQMLINIDRTLMIIRLALLEAVALFGLVILMLSILNGSIHENGIYWYLTAPLFLLIILVLTNFIPKEKMIMRIEGEILFKLIK